MNIFALIVLLALTGDYIIGLVVDILNLKTLQDPLPKEFEEVTSIDTYKKSQAYTRATTSFGITTASFNLIITLTFWFLGGFNWVDNFIRQWNLGNIWTGDCYIFVLLLARAVLSLPFNVYSTFVIEERFGFNTTTVKTFIGDILKGMALSIIIGAPLLSGILLFFEFAGPLAWLYCWIASAVIMLAIQFIAPTWIMPLFNKFTPLEDGEFRRAIFSYAESVKFRLENIFVMDGSKRSSKSNAFFTGFGKNKRIALFDTLVKKHTPEELVAVLAHEIGHYKKKHIVSGIIISILHLGVMFYLLSFFLGEKGLFDAFFMGHISTYAGMIFFGMLFAPIEFVLSLALNLVSRKHEFEADRWAAETTHRPEDLVAALKKLSVSNLSHLTPHPLYVFLHYSHPPVLERITSLRHVTNE
jgi:STE24 endopeptidase